MLNKTAHKILDVAEEYTQTRGFNAFSYKDIQNNVGVKTSSIHYYFPSKTDLALEMIARYTERFLARLSVAKETHTCALDMLEEFSAIYLEAAEKGKFCLCGMMASDCLSIPETAQKQLDKFFYHTENWLIDILNIGKSNNEITLTIDVERTAAEILAIHEGAMLIARTRNNPDYLKVTLEFLINKLKV